MSNGGEPVVNIAMLTHNSIWRSNFFRIFFFARQLTALGHRTTVITIAREERRRPSIEEMDGVEVFLAPDLLWGMGRSGWDPWDTWHRTRFMKSRQFDVVHAFDCRPAVIHPALAQRRRYGTPLVIDWGDWWGRGGIISTRQNPLLRHGFSHVETFYEEHFRTQADWTTTICTELAERAAGLGVPRERMTTISAGADLDQFKPIPMKDARLRLEIPQNVPVLTFAGFVQWDIELLLETFTHVLEQLPQTLLYICGPRSQRTQRWKEEHPDLARSVVEAGVVPADQMRYYLAAADALMLPLPDTLANRGRFPTKLGDYLAMGKPVITNPTGDVATLLGRTGAGVLAPEDPTGYGAAVVSVLEDPELRSELGRKARKLAEEELDYRLLSRRLLGVYESVLAHSAGRSRPMPVGR
jgi:glycosyltransferase involved in cell wall biosynthesis